MAPQFVLVDHIGEETKSRHPFQYRSRVVRCIVFAEPSWPVIFERTRRVAKKGLDLMRIR